MEWCPNLLFCRYCLHFGVIVNNRVETTDSVCLSKFYLVYKILRGQKDYATKNGFYVSVLHNLLHGYWSSCFSKTELLTHVTLRKQFQITQPSFPQQIYFHLHKFRPRDYKIPKAQDIDIDLCLAWMTIRVLKRTTRGSLLFTEIKSKDFLTKQRISTIYLKLCVIFLLEIIENIVKKTPKWNCAN